MSEMSRTEILEKVELLYAQIYGLQPEPLGARLPLDKNLDKNRKLNENTEAAAERLRDLEADLRNEIRKAGKRPEDLGMTPEPAWGRKRKETAEAAAARRRQEGIDAWNKMKEADEKVRRWVEENDRKVKNLPKHNMHWHMDEDEMMDEDKDIVFKLYFGYDRRLLGLRYGEGILASTFQVYKIKLVCTSNDDDDVSPLEVYGEMRLFSEMKRKEPQIIFQRSKDNPQTITLQDPYLLLTGPSDPLLFFPPFPRCHIEARLILKGTTVSVDKYLGLRDVGVDYNNIDLSYEDLSECCDKGQGGTGKHYFLELTHGIVLHSVVATISVELGGNSNTQDLPHKEYFFTAYIDNNSPHMEEIVLLDSRDGKGPAVLDGHKFKLSRQTICLENHSRLIVHIEHDKICCDLEFLHPGVDGEATKTVDTISCMIGVKVKWSQYDLP